MGYTVGIVCSIGVGPERGGREANEDNYLVCQDEQAAWREGDGEHVQPVPGGEGTLLAVADGMGGMEDGELAATVAVRVMAKLYASGRPKDPERALRRYVLEAHDKLHARIGAEKRVRMGTTLTLVWVVDGQAAWVQVGDSRLYLYRSGELRRLTRDQTSREFAVRDGRRAEAYPEELAQSFIFGSRGLGNDATLRLDKAYDSGREPLRRGDRLLLATDGLTGVVDDVSIGDVLAHTHEPQPAAVACMERALARGSRDNVTVLVIRVDEPTLPP